MSTLTGCPECDQHGPFLPPPRPGLFVGEEQARGIHQAKHAFSRALTRAVRAASPEARVTTLAEFLLARLDEDEDVARAAAPGPWHTNAESDEVVAVDGITVAEGFALSGPQTRATTAHMARHDPVRALAEVEAKRRIVAEHPHTEDCVFAGALGAPRPVPFIGCVTCHDWDGAIAARGWCRTLRLLALPHSGHPDYDEAWRLAPRTAT